MKNSHASLLIVMVSMVFSSAAFAQTPAPTCGAVVQEKKLAGAAKNSFLQKCEREATERCEAAAAERKLAGAAKASNVKKCVKDAVGE